MKKMITMIGLLSICLTVTTFAKADDITCGGRIYGSAGGLLTSNINLIFSQASGNKIQISRFSRGDSSVKTKRSNLAGRWWKK